MAKIGDIGRPRRGPFRDARHDVQAGGAEHPDGIERPRQVRREPRLGAGNGGTAALAGRPVARRRVDQREREAVRVELRPDGRGVVRIGKEDFDRLETRLRRRANPVGERAFGEQHVEIGGETGHGRSLGRIARRLKGARNA